MDNEMIERCVDILMKHNPQTRIGAAIVAVELITAMREPTEKIKSVSTSSIYWSSEDIWQMFIDAILGA